MSTDTNYISQRPLSVRELTQVVAKAERSIPGFKLRLKGAIAGGELKLKSSLKTLTECKRLRLTEISCVEAKFASTNVAEDFLALLNSTKDDLGAIAIFWVVCKFRRKGANQQDKSDSIGITYSEGRPYLHCKLYSPKTTRDQARYLTEVIQTAKLPANVVFKKRAYYVRARKGERLLSYGGIGDENPSSVDWYPRKATAEDLVGRVKAVLDRFAGEICRTSWGCLAVDLTKSDQKRLVAALNEKSLPGEPLEASFSFSIQKLGDLAGLMELMKQSKGRLDVMLGGFLLPDKEYGNIWVVTTPKGHELVLNFSFLDPDISIGEYEKKLGIKFKRTHLTFS